MGVVLGCLVVDGRGRGEGRTGDDDDFAFDSPGMRENCIIGKATRDSLRSGRVACYAPDLRDVFECAGVFNGC